MSSDNFNDLEPGITVTKTGGIDLIQRADVVVERVDMSKKLAKWREAETLAMEKALKAREEAETHRRMALEQQKLYEEKTTLSREESSEAAKLAEAVTRVTSEEHELEKQRAAVHVTAVRTEEKRARTAGARILHHEEAVEAEKLAAQHREGEIQAEALVKQFEMEAQAAKLEQQRLELMDRTTTTGERIPLEAQQAEITVEVQPHIIPEQRIADTAVASAQVASAVIRERAPKVEVGVTHNEREIIVTKDRATVVSQTDAQVRVRENYQEAAPHEVKEVKEPKEVPVKEERVKEVKEPKEARIKEERVKESSIAPVGEATVFVAPAATSEKIVEEKHKHKHKHDRESKKKDKQSA
jgi:hypothetical protein